MAASRLLDEQDDTSSHVTVTAEDRTNPHVPSSNRPRPHIPLSNRPHPQSLPSDMTLPQTPSSDRTHPLTPAIDMTCPNTPSCDMTHPLTPPSDWTCHQTPPSNRTRPQTPPSNRTHPLTPPSEWTPPKTLHSDKTLPHAPASDWTHYDTPPSNRTRPQTPPSDRTHSLTPASDWTRSSPDTSEDREPTRLTRGFRKALRKNQDYICIRMAQARGSHLPSEWWKTGMAFIWAAFNLLLTSAVIAIIHERVPDKSISPPLPDKLLEIMPRVKWAFCVTEINGGILVILWFLQWLFLKHRAIVARRFFFLQGLLYMYRMVTMYITTLPVPSMHMDCAPKINGDNQRLFWRAVQLVSAGGLSATNSQRMCGDFVYSGHTVMLTLTFLFIHEYSPRSWLWRCYHVICGCLSAVGIVCILIAHEHYSLDVVVAYFITSRLFYWYHTMANNQALRGSQQNYLSRVWWSPVFVFLEQNVKTLVPCCFSWPVSLPSAFTRPCRRYSKVQ